jgi:hypothetical protein
MKRARTNGQLKMTIATLINAIPEKTKNDKSRLSLLRSIKRLGQFGKTKYPIEIIFAPVWNSDLL